MPELKLIALDAEDLSVISTHLQDAVLHVGDMAFLKREMRFAAVANRWGFLGGLLVVALLGWLLVSILAVAARHRDPAGRLLCLGVFAMLAGQAFINLAMTVGLMPVTGLTLPFLSYGRSSLVVCMLGVALVCNVAARPAYDFGRGDFD